MIKRHVVERALNADNAIADFEPPARSSGFVDGAYRPRERVDLGLGPEVHVGNPLIAPDESFLVFTARELGGAGEVDLILTERLADGSWSTPRPLPPPINSPWSDFAPGLGTDGRTLYFDAATGLRVGRSAEEEAMVVETDYRTFGDVQLAARTTYLVPDTGEEELVSIESVTWSAIKNLYAD